MIKTYSYDVTIQKPVKEVYQRFIQVSEYPKWSKAWGPNQQMLGQYVVGTTVSFIDQEHGGTKVVVEDVAPYSHIKTKHIAMTDQDNQEIEPTDESMLAWIGSREDYFFKAQSPEQTLVTVSMVMDERFADMANKGWPVALQDFKQLCEQSQFTHRG